MPKMQCVNNTDYEDCLTIGKIYEIEIELVFPGHTMKKLTDDNGEFLQTMLDRFKEV